MGRHRTEVEVSATTKGIPQVQRQMSTLMSTAEKDVKKLSERQSDLAKTLQGMGDKGSKAYKQIAQELRAVDREATIAERSLGRLDRSMSRRARQADQADRAATRAAQVKTKEDAKTGGYWQGLGQGIAPRAATYIQRGPGMRQQMVGMAAGSGIRRFGRGMAGMAGSPFTGLSGVAQGLAGIPGGGLLAGPMAAAAGHAQQALAFRQLQQEAMPFLGGPEIGGRAAAAGRSASRKFGMEDRVRGAREDIAFKSMTSGSSDMEEAELRAVRLEGRRSGFGAVSGNVAGARSRVLRARLRDRMGGEESLQTGISGVAAEIALEREMGGARAGLEAERSGASGAARHRVQQSGFSGMRQTGAGFGFGPQEAVQIANQISRMGGISGRDMQNQGLLGTAMGAQRAFGIGPDVAGAFGQGGVSGGVVGGRGRSGEAMADAIGQALAMGLEGSELTDAMQQMAGDIRSWKDTGLPLNTETVGRMGQTFSGLGLGGVRGFKAGRGVVENAKGIGTRGIQSVRDFAVMQELGGFKGGGAEGYEQAVLRMESGDLDPEGMGRLMKRFSGGGGAAGRLNLRRHLGGMGANMSMKEVVNLDEKFRSGGMPALEDAGLSMGDITQAGRAVTGGALKRKAAVDAKKLDAGLAVLPAVQTFEESTARITRSFTELAAGPLSKVSASMLDVAKAGAGVTEWLRSLMGEEGEPVLSSNP